MKKKEPVYAFDENDYLVEVNESANMQKMTQIQKETCIYKTLQDMYSIQK